MKLTGIIFIALLLVASPAFAQDLKIEKDGDPDPSKVNGTLTYTVTATNQGPGPITTPITLKDELPDNAKVIGVFTSDPATCTVNDQKVECQFLGGLDAPTSSGSEDKLVLTINVQPQQTGEITNKAEGSFTGETTNANNKDEITTEVKAADRNNPGNNPRTGRGFRPPPNAIRQFPNNEASDFQSAEKDLNSLNDVTNGEDTGQYNDSSNPTATSGNGAEASTPGAVASANGDEDTLGPVGPQGDVVDEVPTSGPLPDTGGMSPLYWLLPLGGLLLVAGIPVWRWVRR